MQHRRHHHHAPAGLATIANGIAHEFNNLLGAIQGFADLIAEDTGNGGVARSHASRIVDASRCGLGLIEQIRLLSGGVSLRPGTFELADLAEQSAAAFVETLSPAVLLRVGRLCVGTLIDGDRNLLERALYCLYFNAAEALEAGSGIIDIDIQPASVLPRSPRAATEATPWSVDVWRDGDDFCAMGGTFPDDPANWVSVTVMDTGCGMDFPLLSQAFAPFFSTRERALHAGLGLPIALGIAVAHGGGVVVNTAPGRGTTARMVLPLHLA